MRSVQDSREGEEGKSLNNSPRKSRKKENQLPQKCEKATPNAWWHASERVEARRGEKCDFLFFPLFSQLEGGLGCRKCAIESNESLEEMNREEMTRPRSV